MTTEQPVNISYSKDEIKTIAKMQKYTQWVYLGTLIIYFVYAPLCFFVGIALCYFAYKFAKNLRIIRPWTYAVGLLIPLVQVVVAFSLMRKSTKVLRANNIRVGVMGCNNDDLERFLTGG